MGLTLSEQSYTRYLEGKLRETFGFSGTPEAECFSVYPQYLSICSDNVSSQNGRWSCAYLWNISRHKTCHSTFSWHNREGGRLFCRPANEFMGLTLSEQSYTRYLEGKLRETFGFSGTPEARCFWFLNIWYLSFVLTMFRPKWQVVLCLLVKHNK